MYADCTELLQEANYDIADDRTNLQTDIGLDEDIDIQKIYNKKWPDCALFLYRSPYLKKHGMKMTKSGRVSFTAKSLRNGKCCWKIYK